MQPVCKTAAAHSCSKHTKLVPEQLSCVGHIPPTCANRSKYHILDAGAGDDALLERPFWSSLTVRPPLYGADTPHSLFDEKLDFGWNLRNLKCLLSKYKVPAIPGVTTPMTYFGMWKV